MATTKKMPTAKDIIVRKPSQQEKETCEKWPIWECKPSTFDWEYTQTETCLLLKGKVIVTDKKGNTVSFGAGDYVVFPVDLGCTWHVTEAVKKHYNFS